jgi:hypothetical protein
MPAQIRCAAFRWTAVAVYSQLQAECQLESAALLLAVGLSPNKTTKINALTSKLAERYFSCFTRLVA